MSSGVNGQEFQLATLQTDALDGGASFRFTTIKSIDYKASAEKKGTNASDGSVDGFTVDNEKHDGTMTVKFSEWQRFKKWAAARHPGLGICQISFDYTFTYGNNVRKLVRERIIGLSFNEDPRKASDDQGVLDVPLPFFFMKVFDDNGNEIINYNA